MKRLHFGGPLYLVSSSGRVTSYLRGWPVCASGTDAVKRKQEGMTYNRAEVTCKSCLRILGRDTEG